MKYKNFCGRITLDFKLELQNKNQQVNKEIQAINFLRVGKLNEAEDIYRDLIEQGSENYMVYGNLASICLIKGDKKEGLFLLKKTLKLKPINPEAHYNLGKLLNEEGDINEAITSFQKAIKQRPNFPEAFNIQGISLYKKGDFNNAITSFKQAIKLKPKYPEAYNNQGIAFQKIGNINNAILSFQKTITLSPDFYEAHYNLGNSLIEKGYIDDAISSFQKALKIKPDDTKTHNNLGLALRTKGDLDNAILSFKEATKLKPDYTEAHYNLGISLNEKGDIDAAILSLREALKINPDYIEAHKNLGNNLLLNGEYKQGWSEYEYRFKKSKETAKPHIIPQIPQWQGEPLHLNEKLLVVSEQGLGDTMQFMRYIPHLIKRGFDVSLCAQAKLNDLIKVSGIISNPLTPDQGKNIKEGKWIPLLSVPRLLEVTPNNPVASDPYIHCSKEITAKWRERLSKEEKPIIGINWQGNPATEKNNFTGRSIPLELFSKIAQDNDCRFLSLQKGFGSEQLKRCSFKNKFVHCQDKVNENWEFLETAGMILNTDLIITTDTSIAHLAAGMGKPTWCLLKYVPDWRWGLYSQTTFWYPSMRLFRQTEGGNWVDVIKRVSQELKVFLTNKNNEQSLLFAPISIGELFDKITILEIKKLKIKGGKIPNIEKELSYLNEVVNNNDLIIDTQLIYKLKKINLNLWDIEDKLRIKENKNEFDKEFINLARSVYVENDKRASFKKELNLKYGSEIIEEKSYEHYDH